jgi:type IV secretory pathway VirB2 component (pilin)
MTIQKWQFAAIKNQATLILAFGLVLAPAFAFADVEGSLLNIRTQLTGTILPLLSVIGLGFASISFFTGNPQAKQHVIYAILGCVFGFGAQQIVDLIARMVR